MVLHDLNQACRYAHHVAALHQGAIWGQGTPSDVLTEEMLAGVFQVRAQIVLDPVTATPMCVPIGRIPAGETAGSNVQLAPLPAAVNGVSLQAPVPAAQMDRAKEVAITNSAWRTNNNSLTNGKPLTP